MVVTGRALALTYGLSARLLASTRCFQSSRQFCQRHGTQKHHRHGSLGLLDPVALDMQEPDVTEVWVGSRPTRPTAVKPVAQLELAASAEEEMAQEAVMQDLESVARQSFLNQLNSYRALVLDSSYRPIDIVNWQRAVCLELFDKVDVLEYYDQAIRSARQEYPLPAVLRVKVYIRKQAKVQGITLTRRNLLMRDKHTCQYCGAKGSTTVDHVIPTSKGGAWSWDNCVTACNSCNSRKGSKSVKQLGWTLKRPPREPSAWELGLWLAIGALDTSRKHPKEWTGYLFPQGLAEDV